MAASDECAVCFYATANALHPCRHTVCPTCIERWVARGSATCPVCRGILTGTTHHVDAQTRAAEVLVSALAHPRAQTLVVPIAAETHLGITFADCFAGEGPGVRVVRVARADLAYAYGLRAGNVVTHLNGIPVRDHATAAGIANRATLLHEPLVFTVRRRRPWHCCMLALEAAAAARVGRARSENLPS